MLINEIKCFLLLSCNLTSRLYVLLYAVFSIDVQGTTNPRPSLILVATE